jgi:hypothetical protein
LQQQFGVDVRRDIAELFGGASVSVTLAEGRGSVLMIGVADEALAREKVGAALEFLTNRMGEVIAEQPALAALAMFTPWTSPVSHPELAGFQNLHFSVSPEPVVWGVADGHLIFGSSADAVALCLATADGRHPSIRMNEALMQAAIPPTEPFNMASLTDQRRVGAEFAEAIGIASVVSGLAGSFAPQSELRTLTGGISAMLAKLKPVVLKIDFLKSSASRTTFDGRVWRARSVTHYASPEERAARQQPQ